VGLLAGENDMELLAATGVGRDINRHRYSRGEIDEALARPVVRALLNLIRLRNTHAAFGGTFTLLQTGDEVLALQWRQGEAMLVLEADFVSAEFRIVEGRVPHARVLAL
jgi:sucrose phosphorylase